MLHHRQPMNCASFVFTVPKMYEPAALAGPAFLFTITLASDLAGFLPMVGNHQYRIIPERSELNYLNKSLAEVSVKMYIYNRTTKPLNMSFQFFTDLPEETLMFFTVYQKKSNEYKLTATQFAIKLRQLLGMDWFGIDTFYGRSEPPMVWPVKKGVTYRIPNWVPNSELFPSMYAPVGQWKSNTAMYLDNKKTKIFDSDYFFAIDEIVRYQ